MTQSLLTKSAFILCAGLGKRLRPYTDTVPKPMVRIDGRPILDYTLDKLRTQGIENVTMNLNYLAEKIEQYFAKTIQPAITFSKETSLLDTGGGVTHALHTIPNDVFYLINGDALWTDAPQQSALSRLSAQWDSNVMDVLLLLQPVKNMHLTHGVGDYDIDADGRAIRTPNKDGDYMFTGIRLTKKSLFDNYNQGDCFSYLEIMDQAQEKGRLYALIHDADWHHISTPADLERVNEHWGNHKILTSCGAIS